MEEEGRGRSREERELGDYSLGWWLWLTNFGITIETRYCVKWRHLCWSFVFTSSVSAFLRPAVNISALN